MSIYILIPRLDLKIRHGNTCSNDKTSNYRVIGMTSIFRYKRHEFDYIVIDEWRVYVCKCIWRAPVRVSRGRLYVYLEGAVH
jgi:hypothetical protein